MPDESGKIPIDEVSLRPFTDVYEITDCKLNELKLLSKEFNVLTSVNSTLNDGPISISGDGKLFFFTNNSFSKTGTLGIFYCISEAGNRSSPLAIQINDDTYNVTHPYYDSENKWNRESDWNANEANIGIKNPYVIKERLDSRGDYTIQTGFVLAFGRTFKSGKLNLPVNIYAVPHKDGFKIGASLGFNAKNK
jgi:hypothetical protein